MADRPYIVVSATTAAELEVRVAHRVAEGYVPMGGVALLQWGHGLEYMQAVYRQLPAEIKMPFPG